MELPSFEGLKVGSPEYVRIANKRYYIRHKEQETVRSRTWREQNREKYNAWAEKNKARRQANSRRYEYGISEEQFNQKFQTQKGKCPICLQDLVRPVVDHNHSCCPQRKTCGKCNRGLLCQRCNTIIGLAQDSIETLQNAIQYLKEYNNVIRTS